MTLVPSLLFRTIDWTSDFMKQTTQQPFPARAKNYRVSVRGAQFFKRSGSCLETVVYELKVFLFWSVSIDLWTWKALWTPVNRLRGPDGKKHDTMDYTQQFGRALFRKLAPHLISKDEMVEGKSKTVYHRGYWRSNVLSPERIAISAESHGDVTENNNQCLKEVPAVFVDATFDILYRQEANVAIRIGALVAYPKIAVNKHESIPPNGNSLAEQSESSHEKFTFHYIQSSPITKAEIHEHCTSIDVDISTEAEMVANLLGDAFLNGNQWICRIADGETFQCHRNVDCTERETEKSEQQWEVQIKHVNQLQGEVGYLRLSALGRHIDRHVLDMILLAGSNNKTCRLSESEDKLFWKLYGLDAEREDEIKTSRMTNEAMVLSAEDSTVQEAVSGEIRMNQQHQLRSRPTKSDSTVYAHTRKTYIAGSKRKKPKFTLGSI